jgi:hypothetical protein
MRRQANILSASRARLGASPVAWMRMLSCNHRAAAAALIIATSRALRARE